MAGVTPFLTPADLCEESRQPSFKEGTSKEKGTAVFPPATPELNPKAVRCAH